MQMLVLVITHKAAAWLLRQALPRRFLHRYSLPIPRPLPPQRQHSRETVVACTQQLARQQHQFRSDRRCQRFLLQSLLFSYPILPPSIQYFPMAIPVVTQIVIFFMNETALCLSYELSTDYSFYRSNRYGQHPTICRRCYWSTKWHSGHKLRERNNNNVRSGDSSATTEDGSINSYFSTTYDDHSS